MACRDLRYVNNILDIGNVTSRARAKAILVPAGRPAGTKIVRFRFRVFVCNYISCALSYVIPLYSNAVEACRLNRPRYVKLD